MSLFEQNCQPNFLQIRLYFKAIITEIVVNKLNEQHVQYKSPLLVTENHSADIQL